MTTNDINDDLDRLGRAVDWAEMYPRDPDSFVALRRQIRDLRQSVDVMEAKWRKSNPLIMSSSLPWNSQNSSEWSPDMLHQASEPNFLNTNNASPSASE
jgi:hypothetical protein